jgi:hypothetical protein
MLIVAIIGEALPDSYITHWVSQGICEQSYVIMREAQSSSLSCLKVRSWS